MLDQPAQKRRNAAHHHGRRLFLFGGVGVANTAVDFLIYAALVALGVAPLAANVASFMSSNLQSYFLNARVTFRKEGAPAPVSPSGYAKFVAAHLVSLLVSTIAIAMLTGALGPYAAKASALLFTVVWNYATASIFVFKPRGEV